MCPMEHVDDSVSHYQGTVPDGEVYYEARCGEQKTRLLVSQRWLSHNLDGSIWSLIL